MKQYRMFIADIDDTIRPKGGTAGPETVRALREMQKRGMIVAIASGRPLWQWLKTHYTEWGLDRQFDLIIGMNGGEIWDVRKDTVEYFHPLSQETLKEITEKMYKVHQNPFVYRDGYMLALEKDPFMEMSAKRNKNELVIAHDISEMWAEETGKILFRTGSAEELVPVEQYAKTLDCDRYVCFKTGKELLEIQDPRVNKGAGLRHYCEANSISLDEVIAFGDAGNDRTMLEEAGFSVCLANGQEDIKALCDDVTEYTCADDGLGKYLFETLLKDETK